MRQGGLIGVLLLRWEARNEEGGYRRRSRTDEGTISQPSLEPTKPSRLRTDPQDAVTSPRNPRYPELWQLGSIRMRES